MIRPSKKLKRRKRVYGSPCYNTYMPTLCSGKIKTNTLNLLACISHIYTYNNVNYYYIVTTNMIHDELFIHAMRYAHNLIISKQLMERQYSTTLLEKLIELKDTSIRPLCKIEYYYSGLERKVVNIFIIQYI